MQRNQIICSKWHIRWKGRISDSEVHVLYPRGCRGGKAINQFRGKKAPLRNSTAMCWDIGEKCPGREAGQWGLELTESVPVSTYTDFRSR